MVSLKIVYGHLYLDCILNKEILGNWRDFCFEDNVVEVYNCLTLL